MNNADKEEEGGKPTLANGAVHAAGVMGERSEEGRYAERAPPGSSLSVHNPAMLQL